MKRREFLRAGMVAAGGALVAETLIAKDCGCQAARRFRLNYAPHFGMFKHLAGDDLTDQLKFAADQGFTAWEDRVIGARPVGLQRRIARTMETLGMQMGAVAAADSFCDGSRVPRSNGSVPDVLRDVGHSIEAAKRVNARWLTVDLDCFDLKCCDTVADGNDRGSACVEVLKRCAEILEPHGLVLVLESSNSRNARHGRSGDNLSRIRDVCRTIDSPSCGLLFDLYYQHVDGNDVVSQIDSSWPQIAYFQCGDSRGRKEPGTGDIDYHRIFHHIDLQGFTGVVGMEHGNSIPGHAGDQAVIDAYVRVDRC